MMKDYYNILGIDRSASQVIIKKAYRRLVQQLHPDVNPDPATSELIKDVNEAYDVLGDEARRREYDYRLDNPFATVVNEPEIRHRDPAYRRQPYNRPQKPTTSAQYELMVRSLKYIKGISWAGLWICFTLIVDYLVPPKQTTETITMIHVDVYRRNPQHYIVTHAGRKFKLAIEDVQWLNKGDSLTFEYSPLLSILKTVKKSDGSHELGNLATLYGNFIFIPILLLVFSGLGAAAFGSVEFRFNLGIVTTFILIFVLILMM